jgi:hypothetical protein
VKGSPSVFMTEHLCERQCVCCPDSASMWRTIRLFLWQHFCAKNSASVLKMVCLCEEQYVHFHDSASVVKNNASVFMTMHLCKGQLVYSPDSESVWRKLRPFSLQCICIKGTVSVLMTVRLYERQCVRSRPHGSASMWRTVRLFS